MDPREELTALRRMAELEAKATAQPSSGIPVGRGVSQIPTEPGANLTPTVAPEQSFGQKVMGAIETPAALAGGLAGGIVAPVAAMYGQLSSPAPQGSPAAMAAGEAMAAKARSQFYQPRTETSRQILGAVGGAMEALPPTLGGAGASLNALIGPAARQTAAAVRAEGSLIKGAVAAPLEARAARIQAQRVKESELAAPRIDAAKDAIELGFALDPALSNPSTIARLKTGAVGTTGLQSNLSKLNLPVAAKVAREDMGLPATIRLDAKAFETARSAPEISGAYDKVRAVPRVAGDEAVLADIDNLRVAPMIGDTGQAASVNNFLDTVKGQLQTGTSGATAVQSIRQLRRDAQAIYNQQSAGINPPSPEAIARADINMGVARALETAIENSITDPKLITEFRNARTALARTYDYERATNLATGVVDPQALAALAAEGKPLSGKLAKLANVAANFPETMQGGVVREPTFKEKATRSGAAGTLGAIIGSPLGLPGAVIGVAAGAAGGNIASALMARRMATPAYQTAKAMPQDYRPTNMLRPADINYGPNQLTPYDYSQATTQAPNFILRPNEYPPRATFVGPETGGPAQLGYGGTLETLAAEKARARAMSQTLGQQAEAQQAAAEAAARRPTKGAVELQINPLTGVPEIATGVKGATPHIIEATGKAASTAAEKMRTGRAFDMTAEEKIQWGKSLLEGMPIAQGETIFGKLTPQQITSKMQDRAWVDNAIIKARQEAQAFDQIASRAADSRNKAAAVANRERMLDLAEQLQDALGARPVQRGGQGPKTRAFQRNMLTPEQEIQNALAK